MGNDVSRDYTCIIILSKWAQKKEKTIRPLTVQNMYKLVMIFHVTVIIFDSNFIKKFGWSNLFNVVEL